MEPADVGPDYLSLVRSGLQPQPVRQVLIWAQPLRPEYFGLSAFPVFNLEAPRGPVLRVPGVFSTEPQENLRICILYQRSQEYVYFTSQVLRRARNAGNLSTFLTPRIERHRQVMRCARLVAGHLRPGHLVVVATTAYPGMTSEVVRPILESTGLRVGEEIFLAFAHRRAVAPRGGARAEQLPVVVGGCDRISTRLGVRLMQQVSPRVVGVSSPLTAEIAGLLESASRTVQTALANEAAQLCHRLNVNIWEIVEALAGPSPAFRPALAGDHCVPSDTGLVMRLSDLAERLNDEMPAYVADRLLAVLGAGRRNPAGSRVLVLGVALRHDEEDACLGPARKVMERLARREVQVLYHDPSIPELCLEEGKGVVRSQPITGALLEEADCVLILHENPRFDYEAIVRDARSVFDACNATHGVTGREKITRL